MTLIDKQEHIELAAHALKAIAHPLRLKILCVIGHQEFCVQDIVEVVGTSHEGTDAAIRNAIETASRTIRHIDWFEVVETRGHIVDGKVGHFQVTLKIGFRLESE